MLVTIAKPPAQVQCYTPLQTIQFPPKPNFKIFTPINFSTCHGKIRTGFCLQAMKSKTQKGKEVTLSEMDGLDEFEDDEFDDDMFVGVEDDDGEFEGEEDEVIVPLKNMKQWIENRPRGFGEGKEYDTSVEDKLMEEIEQSRQAQLVNVNNLKNNPVKPGSKKEGGQQGKAVAPIQNGFRVRIVNLPKKKNIHRDLQLAFKGVNGIVGIVPLVLGNEKTRDPVCKGIAFVDFKREDEALRFVQNFSGESINFGKVAKKIKCEMMKPVLPETSKDESVENTDRTVRQKPILVKDSSAKSDLENSLLNLWDESASSEQDYPEERHLSAKSEKNKETTETSSASESRLAEELKVGGKSTVSPSSSKRKKELKPIKKKVATKTTKDNTTKLKIPGSANRLKIKDKAMLTDVFSKYGSNPTLTLQEQSK